QGAPRPVLLPLRPLAGRLGIATLGFEAPGRGEGGVVGEGALLRTLAGLAIEVLGACEVAARVAHGTRERERRRALGRARRIHDLRQRAVEVAGGGEPRGPGQGLARLERPPRIA